MRRLPPRFHGFRGSDQGQSSALSSRSLAWQLSDWRGQVPAASALNHPAGGAIPVAGRPEDCACSLYPVRMRRLLVAIVTCVLLLGTASPALASGRVPAGVKRISVTLTFPLKVNGKQNADHRTLAKASTVHEVVGAVDMLRSPTVEGVCPMYVRLSPVLTVVFIGSHGRKLAETRVQVVLGSRGTSGTTACFPIQFTVGTHSHSLVGNSYIRLMGRLIGISLS